MIVKMKQPLGIQPPFLKDLILYKNVEEQHLTHNASLDQLLQAHRMKYSVTAEYKPRFSRWSPTEITTGLHRIYRLVLKQDSTIPASLIEEITFLPDVEYSRKQLIGEAPIPKAKTAAESMGAQSLLRHPVYRELSSIHRENQGSQQIKIAVLDTGVFLGHSELADCLVPGKDFVKIIEGAGAFVGNYLDADDDPIDNWVGHGTHVSGIIGAKGLNMPKGVALREFCRTLKMGLPR